MMPDLFKKASPYKIAVCVVLFIAVIAIVKHSYRIGFDLTPSLPFHLFFVEIGAMPKRGEYISFTTKDLTPYYREGVEFGKQLVGLPGDRLKIVGKAYFINESLVAVAKDRDSKGRPVPQFIPHDAVCESGPAIPSDVVFCSSTIPEGSFFVVATHPMSFDSRYWGYVERSKIIGKLNPLF